MARDEILDTIVARTISHARHYHYTILYLTHASWTPFERVYKCNVYTRINKRCVCAYCRTYVRRGERACISHVSNFLLFCFGEFHRISETSNIIKWWLHIDLLSASTVITHRRLSSRGTRYVSATNEILKLPCMLFDIHNSRRRRKISIGFSSRFNCCLRRYPA